jgi:hypothetical protein
MRLSIPSKDLNSLEGMDIILAMAPKNMTVREVADIEGSHLKAITYIFNSREYTHIGTWPMDHGKSGFHVPIATAEVMDTNQDITSSLRRFAGPRHVITEDTVRYAMGTWKLKPRLTLRGCAARVSLVPVFVVPTHVPAVRVTTVLGHVSSVFCAK